MTETLAEDGQAGGRIFALVLPVNGGEPSQLYCTTLAPVRKLPALVIEANGRVEPLAYFRSPEHAERFNEFLREWLLRLEPALRLRGHDLLQKEGD